MRMAGSKTGRSQKIRLQGLPVIRCDDKSDGRRRTRCRTRIGCHVFTDVRLSRMLRALAEGQEGNDCRVRTESSVAVQARLQLKICCALGIYFATAFRPVGG